MTTLEVMNINIIGMKTQFERLAQLRVQTVLDSGKFQLNKTSFEFVKCCNSDVWTHKH